MPTWWIMLFGKSWSKLANEFGSCERPVWCVLYNVHLKKRSDTRQFNVENTVLDTDREVDHQRPTVESVSNRQHKWPRYGSGDRLNGSSSNPHSRSENRPFLCDHRKRACTHMDYPPSQTRSALLNLHGRFDRHRRKWSDRITWKIRSLFAYLVNFKWEENIKEQDLIAPHCPLFLRLSIEPTGPLVLDELILEAKLGGQRR